MINDIRLIMDTAEYLENLVVPSKDLAYIYCAICILRKELEKEGVLNDEKGAVSTILAE